MIRTYGLLMMLNFKPYVFFNQSLIIIFICHILFVLNVQHFPEINLYNPPRPAEPKPKPKP